MTDEEKKNYLHHKLDDLKKFLDEVRGSGRAYSSSIPIHVSELEWMLSKING